MKVCSQCGESKVVEEFHRDRSRKDGIYPLCKTCTRSAKSESVARVRARDPESHRVRQREYRKRYNERFPDRVREGDRRRSLRKFGIDIEQYEQMLTRQGGRCAICGLSSGSKRLAVDHDHTTGEIRSLLCGPCNMALGQFEQDDRLRKALVYLEEHNVP